MGLQLVHQAQPKLGLQFWRHRRYTRSCRRRPASVGRSVGEGIGRWVGGWVGRAGSVGEGVWESGGRAPSQDSKVNHGKVTHLCVEVPSPTALTGTRIARYVQLDGYHLAFVVVAMGNPNSR